MEPIERKLNQYFVDIDRSRSKDGEPDFEKMWDSIQKGSLRMGTDSQSDRLTGRGKRKRIIMAGALSIALLATPVYAAFTYDWSQVLTYSPGVESALKQGLGQVLEQSVTIDGITLTAHKAFTDANRTVILYSVEVKNGDPDLNLGFDSIGLQVGGGGNIIEGNNRYLGWNAKLGVYQGYFETDWTMPKKNMKVNLVVTHPKLTETADFPLQMDTKSLNTETIKVGMDGIDSIKIRRFEENEGQVLFKSAISFSNKQLQSGSWIRLQLKSGVGTVIKTAAPGVFGTPGDQGEYLFDQVYNKSEINRNQVAVSLLYDRQVYSAQDISLPLKLSRNLMEHSTVKKELNVTHNRLPAGSMLKQITVTPTQIKILVQHQKEYTILPHQKYKLQIGSHYFQGGVNPLADIDKDQTELSFEMSDIKFTDLVDQPITLHASYRIDEASAKNLSIMLKEISEQKRQVQVNIDDYPVDITYYLKDHNLYVESASANRRFGGINVLSYQKDGEQILGRSISHSLMGDGNNSRRHEFEDFQLEEIELRPNWYYIDTPDEKIPINIGNLSDKKK